MIGQISIKTKLGWITALEQNNRIIRVKFSKGENVLISKNLKNFKFSLKKFFAKKNKTFNSKIFLKGNSNEKKVWGELKKIKFGKTKTYGEIAKKYKLSPRYIGKICGQNKIPLIIPCHRVIKSDGSIGGFSAKGGVSLKKKLINFERN